MTDRLPPSVAAEVQRILDGEARRLLAAKLNGDPVPPLARRDDSLLDESPDESTLRVEGEDDEVLRPADGERRDGDGL